MRSWADRFRCMAVILAMCLTGMSRHIAGQPIDAQLKDASNGHDWPGYGRTFGEQHFSPLKQIATSDVARLGLAWFIDLPPGNSVTAPLEVSGTLFFVTGYSI